MFFIENPLDTAKNAGKEALNDLSSGVDALNKATGILDANIVKIGASLARLNFPLAVIEDTAKLQELTYELTTQAMGQTGIIGDALMESMANATYETAKFGVGLEENLNLIKNINDVMKVNTLLSSEQVINMQLLARNAGLTSAEIVPLIEGFATIGVGTDKAIENISTMQKQARDYGINVGQFMKDIGTNIKTLSSYNFADGVEGFSRMVAKAQALRFDVSKTFALSEKLMDPEAAIETAAGFQMLGGAVGDLGDPFKLLQMAQTDAEGLQESIFNMAESAVVFNEKTGEFDIPVTEMYRLREAANLTGMDYQSLTETAIKAAERTKKLDLLSTIPDVPEDFKDLIANMGDIDADGELVVSVPSFDEMGKKVSTEIKKASELDSSDLDALTKQNEMNALSDKEIAMQQLTALQKLAYGQDAAKAGTLMAGVNTPGVYDALDALDSYSETVIEGLDKTINEDALKVYGEGLTEYIASGLQGEVAKDKFQSAAMSMVNTMTTAIKDSPITFKDKLDETNILKNVDLIGALTTKFKELSGNASGLKAEFENLIPAGLADNLGLVGTGLATMSDIFVVAVNKALAAGGDYINDMESGEVRTDPTTGPEEDDFILRPGMDPISFNKDDLLIGGTDLFGEKRNDYMDPSISGLFSEDLGRTLNSVLSDDNRNNMDLPITEMYGLKEALEITSVGIEDFYNNLKENTNINLDIPEPEVPISEMYKLREVLEIASNGVESFQTTLNESTIKEDDSFKKLAELGTIIENISTVNTVGGDVSLNVGGKIDLSIDGRNLPQNISSEQLGKEIVSNPDFTSKLMTIFTNSNNTYSV